MNITPMPSNISIQMPRNERLNAFKVKEVMPEAEFTGLSSNYRVDSQGNRWMMNNDPYTKSFSKYDAYAYEWTVSTGEDYRSSYIKNHDTENMGFTDFLGYVRENGLDKELNAAAIQCDMFGTNKSDYTTFAQQADYLAAYYAQLENHININFKGAEKEAQMKILTETVGKAIKDVSDAYAESAGSFLEKMGQSGEREKVRMSAENLITEKINSYREIIKENPDFAGLKGTDDEWLTGSHRFMASELQKAYTASGKTEKTGDFYSENDLLFIGKIAASLPTGMNTLSHVADDEAIGFALGSAMVKTLTLGKAMGASDGALGTVQKAVSRYQENYTDLVQNELTRRSKFGGNTRGPIDKQAVMNIALKMQVEYENTQSLMKALFKGMSDGYNANNSRGNLSEFWKNMYSQENGKESGTLKTEREAMLFESALQRKDLGADMGFDGLRTGFISLGGYTAKPEGSIVNELLGIKNGVL